jgi:hypothetical protein
MANKVPLRTTDLKRVAAQRLAPSRASTTTSAPPALTLPRRTAESHTSTKSNKPTGPQRSYTRSRRQRSRTIVIVVVVVVVVRDQDRQTSASSLQTTTTNNQSFPLANVHTRRRLSVTDENVASYSPVKRHHRPNQPTHRRYREHVCEVKTDEQTTTCDNRITAVTEQPQRAVVHRPRASTDSPTIR